MSEKARRDGYRRRLSRRRKAAIWLTLLVIAVLIVALILINDIAGGGGHAIARVNRVDVTREDVLAEARAQGAATTEALKPEIVDAVVIRYLLAQEASRRGLHRRPQFPADRRRAMAQLMAASLLRSLPSPAVPSASQIEAYVAAHPERFANRKRLQLVQLGFPAEGAPSLAGEMIEAARGKLASAGTRWNETTMNVFEADLPAPIRRALLAARPGEFVVLGGGVSSTAFAVRAVEPMPLVGEEALRIARVLIAQEARERQASELIKLLKARATIRVPSQEVMSSRGGLNHAGQ